MSKLSFDIEIAKQGRPIVSIEQFDIPGQKITFLFGESGIGKTILSKALFGLLDPTRLNIRINDQPYQAYLQGEFLRQMQRNGFFVFQEPSTHLNPLMPLEEQLREGSLGRATERREILRRLWDTSSDAPLRRILPVYPKPYRPSGGEKQRILLAMAFLKINLYLAQKAPSEPALFVFDEPTGNLDDHFRNRFLALLLEKFRQRPFTILLITHDYSMIGEVHRAHRDLLSRMVFRELCRKEDRLILRDFAPKVYLRWLESAKKRKKGAGKPGGAPVLEMAGEYRVFGRRMRICRDPEGRKPAPLRIHPGEIVYVKAASGVGKTTLAKIIMGLQPCEGLRLRLGGLDLGDGTPRKVWQKEVWGRRAGMVFQHADEALNLNATVKEVFTGLPLRPRPTPGSIRKRLQELFDPPLEEGFLSRKVAYLSGGQKQRLNLLRTFALDTELLILDEPLNGLDFESIRKVMGVIQQKQSAGRAILLISHNEEIFDAVVPPESVYYLHGE